MPPKKRSSLAGTKLRSPGQRIAFAHVAGVDEIQADGGGLSQISAKQREGWRPLPLKARAKQTIIYLNPQGHRQLKQLATIKGCHMNDLAVKAVNLLFREERLPQVAAPDEG